MLNLKRKLYLLLHVILRPSGKYRLLSKFPKGTKILDIGAGKSPNRIKFLFPDIHYTGIDIIDHFVNKKNMSDNYLLTDTKNFTKLLDKNINKFTCSISSHNLEHVDQREIILNKSISTVKKGGFFYLSFPSKNTINLDRGRSGTLNYFDDPTHKALPPNVDDIISVLKSNNFKIIKLKIGYKPIILWLIGLILEPISKISKKVLPGTLQFHGFETIIIAKREI